MSPRECGAHATNLEGTRRLEHVVVVLDYITNGLNGTVGSAGERVPARGERGDELVRAVCGEATQNLCRDELAEHGTSAPNTCICQVGLDAREETAADDEERVDCREISEPSEFLHCRTDDREVDVCRVELTTTGLYIMKMRQCRRAHLLPGQRRVYALLDVGPKLVNEWEDRGRGQTVWRGRQQARRRRLEVVHHPGAGRHGI